MPSCQIHDSDFEFNERRKRFEKIIGKSVRPFMRRSLLGKKRLVQKQSTLPELNSISSSRGMAGFL